MRKAPHEVIREQQQQQQQQQNNASHQEKAIVEYIDSTGHPVRLSPTIIRNYICPKANLAEIIQFMALARALRANPFLNQIYLIKYDERMPAKIVIARDYFLRLAQESPDYRGFESGVIVMKEDVPRIDEKLKNLLDFAVKTLTKVTGEEEREELMTLINDLSAAVVQYQPRLEKIQGTVYPPGYKLIGGWCRVIRKCGDTYVSTEQTVLLSEYHKGQASWNSMPATMIQKVAESQAFRKAFADRLGGVYTPEEMDVTVDEEGNVAVSASPQQEDDIVDVVTEDFLASVQQGAEVVSDERES